MQRCVFPSALCNRRTSVKCERGGFPHPRDCRRCICPGGYAGTRCTERVGSVSKQIIKRIRHRRVLAERLRENSQCYGRMENSQRHTRRVVDGKRRIFNLPLLDQGRVVSKPTCTTHISSAMLRKHSRNHPNFLSVSSGIRFY